VILRQLTTASLSRTGMVNFTEKRPYNPLSGLNALSEPRPENKI